MALDPLSVSVDVQKTLAVDPTSGAPITPLSGALIGAIDEAAAANPSASAGLNGVLKGYWTDFKTFVGALTETAPATDTASSGLNGRLQRIAQRITSLIGQTTNLIKVAGKQSFTRPGDTTAYAIGDLVANSTTAGSVAALAFTGATISGNGGTGRIAGLILRWSAGAACTLRAHFLKTNHAVTNGDNGAFVLTSLDDDNYIGSTDIVLDGGSGGLQGHGQCSIAYELASGDTIYALIEARSAFSPGNAAVLTAKAKFERFS